MSAPLLACLFARDRPLAARLAEAVGAELAALDVRRFPDGESYLRYRQPVDGRDLVLLCALDRPDPKVMPLLFAAAEARALGAARIGLVAPYLAYLRQDRRFHDGEALTSAHFADILSRAVDWVVTVDPHLHRLRSLDEVYGIPSAVLHAAPMLAAWIAREVDAPLLVGPDSESEQWVASVAEHAGAPHLVLEKTRRGDRDVEITVPDLGQWPGRTPVLVDDIVSTGQTMVQTVRRLKAAGTPPPVCVAVHGLFAGDAHAALRRAGAARVASTNTIPHVTNLVDVAPLLAGGVARMLGDRSAAPLEPPDTANK